MKKVTETEAKLVMEKECNNSNDHWGPSTSIDSLVKTSNFAYEINTIFLLLNTPRHDAKHNYKTSILTQRIPNVALTSFTRPGRLKS